MTPLMVLKQGEQAVSELAAMKEKSELFLFGSPGIFIFPQQKKKPSSTLPSTSLLCLRYAMAFLLFQASEAQAELRQRRRLEDLNRWRFFFFYYKDGESGGVREGGGWYVGGLINYKLPGFCCSAFVRACKSVDGTQLL